MVVEGFPTQSSSRANALYGFSANETANPWEYTSSAPFLGPTNGIFESGFGYASFLLGSVDSLNASAITDTRLGKHEVGFFLQDNWKLTRKLTLEYGLRWDYSSMLQEEHGRMQSACFQCPENPNAGAGGFNHPAEWPCGLYQIAVQSELSVRSWTAHWSGLSDQFQDGIPRGRRHLLRDLRLQRGLVGYRCRLLRHPGPGGERRQTLGGDRRSRRGTHPHMLRGTGARFIFPQWEIRLFAPGNIYGNRPTYGPAQQPRRLIPQSQLPVQVAVLAPAFASPCRPLDSPFITIDKGTGRLPRIFQWSIGLQREIMPNLIIEAAYVGNRGAWFTSPDPRC